MDAIKIKNLQFGYAKQSPVLDIRDLRISMGAKVFLQGESGSGKSTLLSILSGILPVAPGAVSVLDYDLGNLNGTARDRFRAKHLGIVFQQFNLIPYLSISENISLPIKLGRPNNSDKNIFDEVKRLANLLHIDSILDKRAIEISVGQAQRAAAARALIGNPEIILADEPTSALDYNARNRFLELLFTAVESAQGTLVFVSHDTTLHKHFDRHVILNEVNSLPSRLKGLA